MKKKRQDADTELIGELASALDHALCFAYAIRKRPSQYKSFLNLLKRARIRAGMIDE